MRHSIRNPVTGRFTRREPLFTKDDVIAALYTLVFVAAALAMVRP